jgi:uncharacterized protein (TIGR02246 family)
MTIPRAAVVLVVLLAAAVVEPAAAQPPAGDKQAVFKALEAFANAFNARDAKIAATFEEKGILVNAQGDRFEGRAAIEKQLQVAFAGHFKQAKLSVTAESIRLLTPDVAIQDDLFYIANQKDAKGAEVPARLSHYAMVWVMRGGSWQIALLQTMIPNP